MKAAMDCCMQLHQWDQALQLAQRCNFTEAEDLLQQYTQHLLEKKKYLEAVELFRKVCMHSGWAVLQGSFHTIKLPSARRHGCGLVRLCMPFSAVAEPHVAVHCILSELLAILKAC